MSGTSLYRQALGDAYRRQSAAGQALHDAGTSTWSGRCRVDGGETLAGRTLARLFGLPAGTEDAAIEVAFVVADGVETWTRHVGGRAMRSRQFLKPGVPGRIVEQFGWFAFDLALRVADGRLRLAMEGMRLCGLPLPRSLWPRIGATEYEADGRFFFDVSIALPLVGRLVRYRGWLTGR
ncbi:DUF4166 domain-containing protein [Reyranella sp.]|uniref:DUF4166 domain-containing protein n=1 Tax=Reyranella sp. TaxID=1929291 RepID=UPI003BAB91B2